MSEVVIQAVRRSLTARRTPTLRRNLAGVSEMDRALRSHALFIATM